MSDLDKTRGLDQTAKVTPVASPLSIKQYRIESLLGAGGMGSAYLAYDDKLQRRVALKILSSQLAGNPEMQDRFLREARAQASLNHPNVATIYETGSDGDTEFIAMEFIEGKTLKDLLAEQLLPIAECLRLFLQICAGMSAAHERGIIHRDIKPGNIMINNQGVAKVLDFGLAKDQSAGDKTLPGTVMGTVAYMSPEQAMGQPVDARSDLFSLGTLFYEMVSGQVPFKGGNVMSVLFSVVHQPHVEIRTLRSDTPQQFSHVIDRALEKTPSNRFQTVAEMADALRASSPLHAPALSAVPPAKVSVAVLPFENLGAENYGYFAEGIGDEINGYLARLSRLKVISYSSSRQYKPGVRNIKQIGKELEAEYLLEGAIYWDVNGPKPFVRIRVRLIECKDESVKWSQTYDKEVDQIFAVQSAVGEQVAKALGLVLGEPELKALSGRQTVSVEAYDYFLRANELFPQSVAQEDLDKAIELYQKATELDPNFALAFARLSRVHISMYWFHYDHTPTRLTLAKRSVDKALAIQPDLPEAHQALGYYYYYGQSNYQEALEEFNQADSHRPNDASILASRSYIQRRLGKWNEALESISSATDLDPKSALMTYERANTLLLLRRYDEAISYYDRCLWLTPGWSDVYVKKAMAFLLRDWSMEESVKVITEAAKHMNPTELAVEWILQDAIEKFYDGDIKKALEDLWVDEGEMEIHFIVKARLTLKAGNPIEARSYFDSARILLESKIKVESDDPRIHIHLAITYAGLGKKPQAIESANRALAIVPFEKDKVLSTYLMELKSLVLTMIGEKEEAISLLRTLLLVPSNFSVPLLRRFSAFDNLRSEPSFLTLIDLEQNPAN